MKYLSPKAAAAYLVDRYGLPYTQKTLANRRHAGLGPRYTRLAKRWPRYKAEWLDEFASPPLEHASSESAPYTKK
jgi:hypothetical protein